MQDTLEAGKVHGWVRVFTEKPGDLSLIPEVYVMGGERGFLQLSPDLSCALGLTPGLMCTHLPTPAHTKGRDGGLLLGRASGEVCINLGKPSSKPKEFLFEKKN